MLPVYVINFNRLTWTEALCAQLASFPGVEPVIIDNGSSYPKLLQWYNKGCPYKVIRLPTNCGQKVAWEQGCVFWYHTHKAFWGSEFYGVTDHDLDLSGCPRDLFDVLADGFRHMPTAAKIGVSLEIEDITDYWKGRVYGWESQYWQHAMSEKFWIANVDTTLAIYRAASNHGSVMTTSPALRSNRPYTAKHRTWYLDVQNLSEEDAYYFARCNPSISSWRP